jgi:hypothetical protein
MIQGVDIGWDAIMSMTPTYSYIPYLSRNSNVKVTTTRPNLGGYIFGFTKDLLLIVL